MDAWARQVAVGRPLPAIPRWLADDLVLPLELDPSYELARRGLRTPLGR